MKTKTGSESTKMAMLKASTVFSGVSDAGLKTLAQVAIVREYESGEILFYQEEKASGFYILVTGAINVYRAGMDGRQQTLHVFEDAGDVCGEVPVFEGSTYPAAADAAVMTRLLFVPRDDFMGVTSRHPEILLEMLAVLSKRLRRFVGLIDDLSLKDVSSRLAKHLLMLAKKTGGNTVTLSVAKGLLASRLGTIAETVSRTFRKLQQQGLITVDGRVIRILDPEGLSNVAEGSGQI